MKKFIGLFTVLIMSLLSMHACRQGPPIRMAQSVNLDSFMGDWYVIAHIPTFIEQGAHNAMESYSRKDSSVIETTFTFNKDNFNGPKKTYHPTGFVTDDPSNAEWQMQFLWPFKSEYIIVYVDPAYQFTLIGRTKRDYVWIMARKPIVSELQMKKLIQIAVDEGYDSRKIRTIPQQ